MENTNIKGLKIINFKRNQSGTGRGPDKKRRKKRRNFKISRKQAASVISATAGASILLSDKANRDAIRKRVQQLKTYVGRKSTGTKVNTQADELLRTTKEKFAKKPTTTTIDVPSFRVRERRKKR